MITQNPRVILEIVQSRDHRVRDIISKLLNIIGLKAISSVNQKKVGICFALIFHDGRIYHAMQIACLEHGNCNLAARFGGQNICRCAQDHDASQYCRHKFPEKLYH